MSWRAWNSRRFNQLSHSFPSSIVDDKQEDNQGSIFRNWKTCHCRAWFSSQHVNHSFMSSTTKPTRPSNLLKRVVVEIKFAIGSIDWFIRALCRDFQNNSPFHFRKRYRHACLSEKTCCINNCCIADAVPITLLAENWPCRTRSLQLFNLCWRSAWGLQVMSPSTSAESWSSWSNLDTIRIGHKLGCLSHAF